MIAQYTPTNLPMYKGNPLIEALPRVLNAQAAINKLAHRPEPFQATESVENEELLHLVQDAMRFFQPLSVHVDIEQRFSRMIRGGYQARNPLEQDFWQRVDDGTEQVRSGYTTYERYAAGTLGFNIMGTSGVGKTTAVDRTLLLYPQVIFHNEYQGQPFTSAQLVWLKLSCPHDGSVRGLCLNFFEAIDILLNTKYYLNYARNGRATVDELLVKMARVASVLALGALVIDEIQFLDQAKSGGAKQMLNFFTQLQNTIGVPVVLVGTSKAFDLLTSDFRQARRATGQGDLVWERMKQNTEWDLFLSELWRYQYVRSPQPLSRALNNAIYYHSQGIADIAVKLFMLAQYRAINTRKASLTKGLIDSVANDSLRSIKAALDALRRNDVKALQKYEDLIFAQKGQDWWAIEQARALQAERGAGGQTKVFEQQVPPSGEKVQARNDHSSQEREPRGKRQGEERQPRTMPPGGVLDVVEQGNTSAMQAYEALK
jgi:hypothetical protein